MPEIQKFNFSTENKVRSALKTEIINVGIHIHQFAEILYIIDGELTVKHDGIQETARSGDIIAIMPYQEHGLYSNENCKVQLWITLFSEDFMTDIIYHENASLGYKNVVFKTSPELKSLIEAKMFDTGDQIIEPDFELIINLKSLIYTTFLEYFKNIPPISQSEAALQNKIVSSDPVTKTVKYLRINFRNDISIEDCAKEIGYSASHISHCLQKNFHMTFLQLRDNMRINYAKYLLKFKRISVYMVGIECGFNCESTFERVFKKYTRMTTRQYRKRYMK
ncbi:MAG: helix-turn-helix transcriptional regulator [Clostridia bacterium]|nr:helix-turn-helix transcriptional regulator [Clostridia bacterium]